jgi:Protein of unknown function (DUF3102)
MTETVTPKPTPTAPTPMPVAEQFDLAKRIKACIEDIGKATHGALMRAIEAGELLLQAKVGIDHGRWGTWLETCGLSDRTAQRYMKVAEGRPKIEAKLKEKSATVADLTLRQAEGLLSSNSGNDISPSVAYDNAEKSLLKKLKALPIEEADDHAQKTIKDLKETVSTMRAGAKKAA